MAMPVSMAKSLVISDAVVSMSAMYFQPLHFPTEIAGRANEQPENADSATQQKGTFSHLQNLRHLFTICIKSSYFEP